MRPSARWATSASSTTSRARTSNPGANPRLARHPMANDSTHPAAPSAGNPELVVMAKPVAGLRAHGLSMVAAPGVDVASLRNILSAHGATMRPLFGLSED